MSVSEPIQLDQPTVCYRHPATETALRCITCGKYICSKCAKRTPVGYRCPDCLNNIQSTFFNMSNRGYLIAGAISFLLGLPAVFILDKLGLFLIILLGVPAGGFISEIVARVIKGQRGKYLYLVVGGSIALAGLVICGITVVQLLGLLAEFDERRQNVLGLLGTVLLQPVIVTALCAVTAGARFRYGK